MIELFKKVSVVQFQYNYYVSDVTVTACHVQHHTGNTHKLGSLTWLSSEKIYTSLHPRYPPQKSRGAPSTFQTDIIRPNAGIFGVVSAVG